MDGIGLNNPSTSPWLAEIAHGILQRLLAPPEILTVSFNPSWLLGILQRLLAHGMKWMDTTT